MIKKILLATIVAFVFISCSKEEKEPKRTVNLPITIDFHQFYNKFPGEGGPYSYTYEQSGLKVEIFNALNPKDNFGTGRLTMTSYEPYVKVSNLSLLKNTGFKSVYFTLLSNNSKSGAHILLYNKEGKIIESIISAYPAFEDSTLHKVVQIIGTSENFSKASYLYIYGMFGTGGSSTISQIVLDKKFY